MVYIQDQTSQTSSLANPPLQTTLPGIDFLAPLHGILYWCGLIYATHTSTPSVPWRHNHHKHSYDASISIPLCRQLYNASTIVNIGSFNLDNVAYLIIFTVFYLIWLTLFDCIWITFLTGFDLVFLFDSTQCWCIFSIRFTSSEPYSVRLQGVPN